MADRKFESFEGFWPYYVSEHKEKGTRILHFVGTTAAMGCIAGAVVSGKRWLLLAAPVVGYSASWIGHFVVEKNKPATFKHPLWSLRGDMVMWWKTMRGELQAEVDRVVRDEAEQKRAATSPEAEWVSRC
jgi:hypothetical protein